MTGGQFLTQPLQSHADHAYRVLEALIVTLELRPGSVVTEKGLVDRVGLGRTPVREALQKLSWEGLVEVRPRSGIKISDIRPEDYVRVMEPRLLLEPLLARAAARFADDHMIECLITIGAAMEQHAAAGDVAGFLAADKRFDQLLEEACPNPYLTKVLDPLRTHARRYWYRYGATGRPQESATLHVRIIGRIKARDEAGAAAAMSALMDYINRVAVDLAAP